MTSSLHGAALGAVVLATSTLTAQQFDPLPGTDFPFVQAGNLSPLAADFDGDGNHDLFYGGQVRTLLLRTAPGRFTEASARITRRSGLFDRDTAAVDFDQDGDLDLLIAVDGRGSQLHRNDGPAGFVDVSAAQPWSTAFPLRTQAMATGDVDGDGRVDVVFGNTEPFDQVFLSNGSGFTGCPNCQPFPQEHTVAVLLEDFDGDGDLDLLRLAAPGNGTLVGVLETNDGQGHWTLVPGAIPTVPADVAGAVAVDRDQDGDLDVLAYGQDTVMLVNAGGTSFSAFPGALTGIDSVRSISVADRNGDGFDDLLVTSLGGTHLLRGSISGRFLPFPGITLPDARMPTFAGEMTDVDADGDLDVLVSTGQQELWLAEGDRFVSASRAELTSLRGPLAVGDLDGDGDPDVLLGASQDPQRFATVQLNDGDGRFRTATPLPAVPFPSRPDVDAMRLGDLDGDGDLDAVVGQNNQQPEVLLGRGDGTFTRPARAAFPVVTTSQTAVALGDVDGDGDLDAAFAGNGLGGTTNAVALYLNDGTGIFAAAPAGSVPALFELAGDLEFADTDGDGDLDLLVGTMRRVSGTQLQHWRNDGQGGFTAAMLPPDTPSYDTSVTVADFDGDGDLDVATGGALLANDGTGTFTDVTAIRSDAALGIAPAFVDLDLDGDLDLLTYQVAFRQDAAGVFRSDPTLFAGSIPRVYAVTDVDRDGDPDLLGSYALYRNLQREISVPDSPRVGGSLRIRIDNRYAQLPVPQVALVLLATQRLARPVALPDFGLFHLDPVHVLDRFPIVVPPTTAGELAVRIPNQVSLAGGDVHTQALILSGLVTDWRLTRAETVTIVR